MSGLIMRNQNMDGTCQQGELNISYKELVQIFGEPNEENDGYKTDAEWSGLIHGSRFSIYNYKTGKNYNGDDGQAVEDIMVWYIGGSYGLVAKDIQDYIEEARSSEPPTTEIIGNAKANADMDAIQEKPWCCEACKKVVHELHDLMTIKVCKACLNDFEGNSVQGRYQDLTTKLYDLIEGWRQGINNQLNNGNTETAIALQVQYDQLRDVRDAHERGE